MQQKWWLIAAGVIGIGLAVLLFPRPDTGGDVPAPDPTNTAPLDFKNPKPGGKVVRRHAGAGGVDVTASVDPRSTRRDIRPAEERLGANPIAAEFAKNRGTPESIHAGRASGPWTVVRRQLTMMSEDPQAAALADELQPFVLELRALRRDPAAADYATLEAKQKELIARIRANEAWMADKVIVASVDRLDGIMAEYHEDASAKAEAPADDAQE